MDIKDIKLENKNNTVSNYMIVLEESNNYDKYKISKNYLVNILIIIYMLMVIRLLIMFLIRN